MCFWLTYWFNSPIYSLDMLSKGLGYLLPGFLGGEESHESDEQSSNLPSSYVSQVQGSILLMPKEDMEYWLCVGDASSNPNPNSTSNEMEINMDGSGDVESMVMSKQRNLDEERPDIQLDSLLEKNEAMQKRLSVLTQDQEDSRELLEKRDEELKQLKVILREMNERGWYEVEWLLGLESQQRENEEQMQKIQKELLDKESEVETMNEIVEAIKEEISNEKKKWGKVGV